VLASQFADLTRTKFFDCKAKCRDKGKKIGQTVCLGPKNNNSERPIVKPLLFRQTLVNCDQDIEAPGHGIQQGTIIKITPTHLWGCLNLVHRQFLGKASRHATIKKNSHTRLRRYSFGKKRRLRKFQYGNSVLAGNARKVR
jgi:hypothetical protein